MYRVGVLLLDGFALMSYASLVEPFRAANFLDNKKLYEIMNLTEKKQGAVSSSGLRVESDYALGDFPVLDLLMVVAGGDPFQYENKSLFNWINKFARFGVMIGGVSGGPIILVKSGLMKDYRMTVHWEHAPSLLEIYDDLLLEKSLFIFDRDRITCAGGTAPIDMALALIARRQGTSFAQFVSDWFLHTEIRPSGGPQRSNLVNRVGTTNSKALTAIELMETHIADPLSLENLGNLTGLSRRQLNRVFKKAFNKGTMEYYREIRLEKSRNLLRNSRMSIAEISEVTGFCSASHFSSSFLHLFAVPPSDYRKGSQFAFIGDS